jgi:hypothetical protein
LLVSSFALLSSTSSCSHKEIASFFVRRASGHDVMNENATDLEQTESKSAVIRGFFRLHRVPIRDKLSALPHGQALTADLSF